MVEIVVATRNRGKLKEIKEILENAGATLRSLEDFPGIGEIPEHGETFEENALFKAETVAKATGKIALADDSGICVDYIGGAPGLYSARYSGEGATDRSNNDKLLAALKGVPKEHRGARFVCVMAAVGRGESLIARGECVGFVAEEERGKFGFGYDPLFYYPPLGKTYAEMTPDEKNPISHRGRALAALKEKLPGFLKRLG